MAENPNPPSLILIKVLLIIITLAVCLQTYWTYIVYEKEIENFHDSEYQEQKAQEEKIKALEEKIRQYGGN
jgi:uncharacterized membrane protein